MCDTRVCQRAFGTKLPFGKLFSSHIINNLPFKLSPPPLSTKLCLCSQGIDRLWYRGKCHLAGFSLFDGSKAPKEWTHHFHTEHSGKTIWFSLPTHYYTGWTSSFRRDFVLGFGGLHVRPRPGTTFPPTPPTCHRLGDGSGSPVGKNCQLTCLKEEVPESLPNAHMSVYSTTVANAEEKPLVPEDYRSFLDVS